MDKLRKYFNTEGVCIPSEHYMVNLDARLVKIKQQFIDKGKYFTINRARQYGKTTTLQALAEFLQEEYVVIELDFQMLSYGDFESEASFIKAFSYELLNWASEQRSFWGELEERLEKLIKSEENDRTFSELFRILSMWCAKSSKPIVLIIDEVDSATNNQVFLDFLSQLRGYYIHRRKRAAFQSVILAGVYDIKNLKRKLRSEDEHRLNSPWNIAADFDVQMSFSVYQIREMLDEYKRDHNVEVDTEFISNMIYDYTSGYPFLVSRICKIIDETLNGSEAYPEIEDAWSKAGILDAVKILVSEKNALFESALNKIREYPELSKIIHGILFNGREKAFNLLNSEVEIAFMFGFVKNCEGNVMIANRIFETVFYNWFLTSVEMQESDIVKIVLKEKNQFIRDGHLDMDLVLEKFVQHFDELYGDQPDSFREEDGRRYFLLYLRPIINGTGNYYIEAQTRNHERTDVIVDYGGEQFIIEMKIWRGDSYNRRGEEQLSDYLEHYHLKKGYMLSFNFNKHKEIGVKQICLKDKIIVEAVV